MKYIVEEPDSINPEHPVVYTLETFGEGLCPVLTQDQPGPFIYIGGGATALFIELETLVKLGEVAKQILFEDDQVSN